MFRLTVRATPCLISFAFTGCALDWGKDNRATDTFSRVDAGPASDAGDGAVGPPAEGADGGEHTDGGPDASSAALSEAGSASLEASVLVPCGQLLCQHGGTCGASEGPCQCPPGWTGPDCSVDVDECLRADTGCSQDFPCANTAGAYTCLGQFAEWPIAKRATAVTDFTVDTVASTVIDETTGLMWERNSAGVRGDFASASDHCGELTQANFAGFSDWRVPSFMELASLITTPVMPLWDSSVFADNPEDDFWSATPAPPPLPVDADSGAPVPQSIGFDMEWGIPKRFAQSESLRTRCVRTVRLVTSVAPADRLDLSNVNLVKDRRTGLVWQRNTEEVVHFWGEIDAFCKELRLAGLRWRMPTYVELLSLYDPRREGFRPPPVFNGDPEGCYASSTVSVKDPTGMARMRVRFWVGGPQIEWIEPSGDFQWCPARCVHDPSM